MKIPPRSATAPRFRRLAGALLLVLLGTATGVAQATCADPAAPGVNWRRCYLDSRDLTGVTLDGAMLREATFQRSDLSGARMQDADAYRAKFLSAKLINAVMDRARLIEADLTRADMKGVSLIGADLRNAKLVGANMVQADLSGALLDGTDLRNANLSGARWTDGTKICAAGSTGQCH